MSQSFTCKSIETRLTLAKGSFGGAGNTKIIKGLATRANVEKPGFPDKPKCTVEIANLPLNDMEQLTTLAFKPLQYQRNSISVYAGEEGQQLSLVFNGEITSAYGDFNSAPDPVFKIEAMSGFFGALTPKAPTATPGSVPVADIISQQAAAIGYTFRNEGFTGQVNNSVFNGSPMEQAQQAAKQAGAELIVDDGQLILMKPGAARSGTAVVLNKDSGLIGYPTFNNNGISLKCLYNPALQYGGVVRVQSIVPKATGDWRITKVTHKLSAYDAGSMDWFSEIEGTYRMGM